MFAELTVPVSEHLMQVLTALGATPASLAEACNMALIGVAFTHLGESAQERELHGLLEELAGELHRLFENETVVLARRASQPQH